MKDYNAEFMVFGEWCAEQGMLSSYHHHMGVVLQFEREPDLFMNHSGEGIPLLFDAGHLAFEGGDCLHAINSDYKRITYIDTKNVRIDVTDGLDRKMQSLLDAAALGAFTVLDNGSLDFEGIVQRLADYGYQRWFVVETNQDPIKCPPLKWRRLTTRR